MVENEFLLKLGDYFFMVFHTALVLFNLFAWLYNPLIKWHLATIVLTFASWGGWGFGMVSVIVPVPIGILRF